MAAHNNVALVSGAARGLGEQVARRLHAAGYRVAVADIDLDGAGAVARGLDPGGGSALALRLDVRVKADFTAALALLQERWGGVHVLVNNAGQSRVAPLMEITPEDFDAVVAVNLKGVFLACQVFGAAFARQGYGRVINIASLAGQTGGTATGAHYAAAKGGVLTLTKVFARELAADGVTVNAISPGPLDLPIVHESVPAERLAAITQTIPTRALGDAGFIADAVVLLASPQAGSATGACWDINGGLFMR
ncbi:SDR family NAD(P)-dependent oxidoreductase [Pseudoduganella namucuonensis]|uniref:3-oxoacyl-[acyl-carrier protein] reductase n=1 Tax=Pseudoduganella namucuonensis TaxID=1035707 RepID=A0A1I7LZH1_9BURK|nr:SDR family NAD(P)-dependent oxidoreductase [Pseudoduganella namucuonensis]SFV15069.1 3-oxoacyl-[acyl-carrier protein] reductase [Pseudoduganella namucuonensis]